MIYFKNNIKTNAPRVRNVSNPTHERIILDGWFEYVENPPSYDAELEKLLPTTVVDGVQNYEILPIPPDELEAIRKAQVPFAIDPPQGRILLNRMGLLPQVNALVDNSGDEDMKIFWEFATTWQRTNAYINMMGALIGLDDLGIDNFFTQASKI